MAAFLTEEQKTNPDALTRPFCFTKTMRRDVYPAIDPENKENSLAGAPPRGVIITGGSRGIGKVSTPFQSDAIC